MMKVGKDVILEATNQLTNPLCPLLLTDMVHPQLLLLRPSLRRGLAPRRASLPWPRLLRRTGCALYVASAPAPLECCGELPLELHQDLARGLDNFETPPR